MTVLATGLVAGLTAVALVLLVMPRALVFLARHCREPVATASPRLAALHAHKESTPTMGGLVILTAVLIVALALAPWGDGSVWAPLVAALAFGVLGAVDDLCKLRRGRGLGPLVKLAAQFAASVPVCWILASAGLPGLASALWIVALANAVNLTDGLDGLAAGCVALSAATLAFAAALAGHVQLVPLLAATSGATLGFLRYNSHPARVFMGDTGSLALGALLATASLAAGQKLALFSAGGVFMVEMGSVAVQIAAFRLAGRRVFRCAPLHHHFQFLGWPEPRVVRRFWGAACLCGLLTLAVCAWQQRPPTPTDGPAAQLAQDARLRQLHR